MKSCLPRLATAALLLIASADSNAAEDVAADPQERTDVVETAENTAAAPAGENEKDDDRFLADLMREAESFFRQLQQKYQFESFGGYPARDLAPPEYQSWCSQELSKGVLRITGETDIRTGVEILIRRSDQLSRNRPELRQHGAERQKFVLFAAIFCAYVSAADKRLQQHIFSSDCRFARRFPPIWATDWDAMLLASIDAYEDDRSREILLDYALQPRVDGVRVGWYGSSSWAIALLRSYDPEKVRPRIEEALRAAMAQAEDTRESEGRRRDLQCLINSLDYAASLSPEDRAAYHYFERSLWHAHAFIPHGTRGIYVGAPDWKVGNERFLVHLLDGGSPRIGGLSFWRWKRFTFPAKSITEFETILESGNLSDVARWRIENILSARRKMQEREQRKEQ